MTSESSERWELGQLAMNVMPLLILATLSASMLVLSPWGIDPLYSGLTHFFTLWPLFLLATITYIAWVKITEEEREVPTGGDSGD